MSKEASLERRRLTYASLKRERERSSLRRARSIESGPSQESKRAKERRIRGEKAEQRTSAERTASASKCDYRTSASREDAKKKNGISSQISAISSATPKKSRQIAAPPKPDDAAGDHIDTAIPETERNSATISDIPPSCFFVPNIGRGGCFFLCVEQATGCSVSSQRILLATQLREGSLELYQALLSDSEAALAQVLEARNSGEFVSSQSVMRSREIVEEMQFCRGATDLDSLRSRLLTRSYWADAFAVERIQVLLNVKAIVISIGGWRRLRNYAGSFPERRRILRSRPIFRRKARRCAL